MLGLQPLASATLVGSMPHRDRGKVIELILRTVPEIPVWPQLPSYPSEGMMVQYLEGLPGVHRESERTCVRTDTEEFDRELYAFYEEYLEVESEARALEDSRFKMGSETGESFFRFLEILDGHRAALKAVKGQIVGPFTLLAGMKDQQDRALLYDDRLQDAVAKHLAMKAKWQIGRLRAFGCPVIVFLDEPALAGFGSSAFISVTRELVQSLLKEVVEAVHQAGGLAGIHVCANTDWLLAFESGVDIINFDAYKYFDRFALYGDAFSRFMADGRLVAWGMVPTLDRGAILAESAQSLADKWFAQIQHLVTPRLPTQTILAQSIFTPSCGCACLEESLAERVLELTGSLSELMKTACR